MEFQNPRGDYAALRLKRVEDLWFSDGSIVVRVGEQACRIHQSILAANSSVLANILSIPQPKNGETFEGLPMMSFPDPPEDVLHWLKSMVLPGYFEVYPSRIQQDKLLATLRLSHKYGVQTLRQRALYHLSVAFPSVFGDEDEAKLLLDKDHWRKTSIDGDFNVDFFCKVYALAVEIGADWLLPSLIYTIHSATYFDDNARARLPALLSSQAMLQLLNVTRASLAAFQPHRLTPILSNDCEVGGTKCTDGVRDILDRGFDHLIAQPLSFLHIKANTFMTDCGYATVKEAIEVAACNKCKEVFRYPRYIVACDLFRQVFEEATVYEELRDARALDTGSQWISRRH
ncbi:uncharacterized protein SCHCODRAFT_02552870 [Schizophyllum commune H4-8]|nr:uncharacterized protein SCHCODRAFT_02552870 [Schizophyllum commune H4-8]KAI5887684.1 hypothetical protein SCHCODRAFT_02552870 [Schizophyllum commune H4-8]